MNPDEELLTLEVKETRNAPSSERIHGRDIPVGNLEAFAKAFGIKLERRDDGQLKGAETLQPYLGVQKFKDYADKAYRLIWIWRDKAWLAAENMTPHRTKTRAVAAGAELAAANGVRFDEVTR